MFNRLENCYVATLIGNIACIHEGRKCKELKKKKGKYIRPYFQRIATRR